MKKILFLSFLMAASAVSAMTLPKVEGKLTAGDNSIDLNGYEIQVLHTCRESYGTMSEEVSREVISAQVSLDGSFTIEKHEVECPSSSNYRKYYVSVIGPVGDNGEVMPLGTVVSGDINFFNNGYRRDFSKKDLTIELFRRSSDGAIRVLPLEN